MGWLRRNIIGIIAILVLVYLFVPSPLSRS
jgi:hypothetical protein